MECFELGHFCKNWRVVSVTFLHTPTQFYELCIFIDEKAVLTKS